MENRSKLTINKRKCVKKMLVDAECLQLFFQTNLNELTNMNKSICNYLKKKINNKNSKGKSFNKKNNKNSSAGSCKDVDEKTKKSLPLHKFKISKDLKKISEDSTNSSDIIPTLRDKDLMSLKRSDNNQSRLFKPIISRKEISLNPDDIFINQRTGEKFSFINGTMTLIKSTKNPTKGINIDYDPPEKIYLNNRSESNTNKKKKSKHQKKSFCKCNRKETIEQFLSHSHSFDTEDDDDNEAINKSCVTKTKKFELLITGKSVDEFNKRNKKYKGKTADKRQSCPPKKATIVDDTESNTEEKLPKSLSVYDLLPSRAVIGLPLLTSTQLTSNNDKANINDNRKKYDIDTINEKELN